MLLFVDDEDEGGCNVPVNCSGSAGLKHQSQSEASSAIRLQIFIAAVEKIGGNITHYNAYGSAVHKAMGLIPDPARPFHATSRLAPNSSILQLSHPSRLVNHANVGVCSICSNVS